MEHVLLMQTGFVMKVVKVRLRLSLYVTDGNPRIPCFCRKKLETLPGRKRDLSRAI